MLDGIYDVYAANGQYLGNFEDDMSNGLLVCAYVYETTQNGDQLDIVEQRAARVWRVEIQHKGHGGRRGHTLFFKKLHELKYSEFENRRRNRTWVHFVAHLFNTGRNVVLAKLLAYAGIPSILVAALLVALLSGG